MNAADIRTGKPGVDGRYVVFVQCAAVQARDWVEPVIMTWAGERWHTTFAKPNIRGWLGPIPVMKVADIETPTKEYDL
jgi:hypothetical protein